MFCREKRSRLRAGVRIVHRKTSQVYIVLFGKKEVRYRWAPPRDEYNPQVYTSQVSKYRVFHDRNRERKPIIK
jgi:hypothetical protein